MTITLPGVAGNLFVITGAAGGQGMQEALLLAGLGADVVAADLRDEAPELQQAAASLLGSVTYRRLDVTDEADWTALAVALGGRAVKGLVNNAGVTHRVRIGSVDRADWDRVLAVNVTGAMLGIQALLADHNVPIAGKHCCRSWGRAPRSSTSGRRRA